MTVPLKVFAIEKGMVYSGLRRYCAEGRIPATKDGCHWMVDPEAARKALEAIRAHASEARRAWATASNARRRTARERGIPVGDSVRDVRRR